MCALSEKLYEENPVWFPITTHTFTTVDGDLHPGADPHTHQCGRTPTMDFIKHTECIYNL